MNYDFLQSYNIPVARQGTTDNQYDTTNNSTMEGAYGTYSMQSTAQSTPAINTAYYGYGDPNAYNAESYQTAPTGGSGGYYQNPERFMPPSKHGSSYTPHKGSFKRKSNTAGGGSTAKKEPPIAEMSSDGTFVMFMGRDESYPDELNALIHPLSCNLCDVKMTSRIIAKDHYESKAHDKHISSWLAKNYTEKGLTPPAIKRFVKQGSTGPDAYYCEACDLKLTSLTHANQHYSGKKHRSVIAQRAKPSGAGFYNSEGKWVRTGTKAMASQCKDQRFGIGDEFKYAEIIAANKAAKLSDTTTTTSVADTTTNTNGTENKTKVKETTKPTKTICSNDQDPALFCSICKVSVTSAVQMTTHLAGSKHMKKLKLAGINPTTTENTDAVQSGIVPLPDTLNDNVLLSAIKEEIKPDPTDLSMYRTPSGQYYCKICNTSMPHLPGLEQHLKGKRHLKKQTEEKALAALANKKN
ncbi:hypothetical protein FF38_13709 [Lucilia cuprina]|uniref:C2H2-type domain-containing protein n=1 Tax=Lucilia cuprina TaxID=7375 RepID=A0A0L0BZ49_LUCCU|nr:Zinc finger matrin-type protein 3 [Lucilia cuprina]KNC25337.1 hypothetical protein FF38_13709 [Lucilia cuprina]